VLDREAELITGNGLNVLSLKAATRLSLVGLFTGDMVTCDARPVQGAERTESAHLTIKSCGQLISAQRRWTELFYAFPAPYPHPVVSPQ
jgi:hypothetical protein